MTLERHRLRIWPVEHERPNGSSIAEALGLEPIGGILLVRRACSIPVTSVVSARRSWNRCLGRRDAFRPFSAELSEI
jgi:hypothetical protein